MQVARHTSPEGHFKVWATILFSFSRGRWLPPTPRAETGLPLLQSIMDVGLGINQSKAWLVEQKALPPQFYIASVTTGIWTHTLPIKQQSSNPVLFTARLWHRTNMPESEYSLISSFYFLQRNSCHLHLYVIMIFFCRDILPSWRCLRQ